jgi:hypothetical protein
LAVTVGETTDRSASNDHYSSERVFDFKEARRASASGSTYIQICAKAVDPSLITTVAQNSTSSARQVAYREVIPAETGSACTKWR